MNKWFRNQYRTDADAKADEKDPSRRVSLPYDPPYDIKADGRPLDIAPADEHPENSEGGRRPLKGGYWYVPQMYYTELKKNIIRDIERVT